MPVCFWEDLVNTVQAECGSGGGGEVRSFAGDAVNCGTSNPRLIIGFFGDSDIDIVLDNALATATEVTLTGLYQDATPVGIFTSEVGDPIENYVVFDDVDYPMTFSGFYSAWDSGVVTGYDAAFAMYFRIDVDGTIFYGATPLTTNC